MSMTIAKNLNFWYWMNQSSVDFKGEIALYELIRLISENLKCGILLISHDLHVVMSAQIYLYV